MFDQSPPLQLPVLHLLAGTAATFGSAASSFLQSNDEQVTLHITVPPLFCAFFCWTTLRLRMTVSSVSLIADFRFLEKLFK
ncbi:hypothetical protein R6Q59_035877 [Mikania micrantha]